MLHDLKNFTCPQCKKPASLDESNRFRPFCGERCKVIDLGSWASGEYAIPTEDTPPTEDNE